MSNLNLVNNVYKYSKRVYSPFKVCNYYGIGKELKHYGYYPNFFPLYAYLEHGISFMSTVPQHELNNAAPCFFSHNKTKLKDWLLKSKKPYFVMHSPFVWYRKRKKISISNSASGTIFFPAHTTSGIDELGEYNQIASFLKKIPNFFHPIEVCLHPEDVKKGKHHIYENAGYKVHCAGPTDDERFVKNFYQINRQFRYSMSNQIGSYTFYCVEMGMPFSLVGPEIILVNKKDKNLSKGVYNYKNDAYLFAQKTFKGYHRKITENQRKYITAMLGLKSSLSRIETSKILYWSLFKYLKFKIVNFIQNPILIKKSIKDRFKAIYSRIEWLTPLRAKQIIKVLFKVEYRKEQFRIINSNEKLKVLNKYKNGIKGHTDIIGKKLNFLSGKSVITLYDEIYNKKNYFFTTSTENPYIIDCGSNIGMSIIYFKELYPKAKIVGFEADPTLFKILQENIHTNFVLEDVTLYNKAVWYKETSLNFCSDNGISGSLDFFQKEASKSLEKVAIQTINLADYLKDRKVDLLKIDIEGAEFEVLMNCKSYLHNVEKIIFEYHSSFNNKQKLGEILSMLSNNDFRYYIQDARNIRNPFEKKEQQKIKGSKFDLQLDIFAYRE